MAELHRKAPLRMVLPQATSTDETLSVQVEKHVREHLQQHGSLANFQVFELNLIREYVIWCYELCGRVGLDTKQTHIIVNVLFEVLRNNNSSYEPSPTIKNLENDFELLKQLMTENPCIGRGQLQRLLAQFSDFYFRNFLVFNYSMNNPQRPPRETVLVVVDQPIQVPPLSEAVEMPRPKFQPDETQV